MTWVYVIIAVIVVVGLIWWAKSRQKKGPEQISKPERPVEEESPEE